jgi:protein required for attachment to host cells
MNRTCIVVADGRIASFYAIEPTDSPRATMALVERTRVVDGVELRELGRSTTGRARTETNTNREAGPVHPVEAQRQRHRIELERRFGREIADKAGELTRGWQDGVVVLVADPRLLGMMRGALREALPRGVELKELAKDYTHLALPELHDHLARNGLLPARRADGN